MKFRTEIKIPEYEKRIEHHHKILTIGSCFAENMGAYFSKYKFSVSENPFGVLYNPASIYNSVKLLTGEKKFGKQDLIYDQGEWHSFYHHSDFSHHNAEECLKCINSSLAETKKFIEQTDWIIVSLGTSFVYEHKDRNIIVSNCHKIPGKEFNRFMLSVDKNEKYLKDTVELISGLNKNTKVLFTVSPVRHWKDGAVNNQLSKASLLLAVDNTVKQNGNCFYFPSYEIVLDELRDYRFYKEDLLHPNELSTGYIWEKLKESLLSADCVSSINEISKVISAANHKVRNPFSEKHKLFVRKNLEMLEELSAKYPYINFENEYKSFNAKIK